MNEEYETHREMPKDFSEEAREARMISMANNLAYKKLEDGTASNQLILFFLNQGSEKTKVEKKILNKKAELLTEQTDAIRTAKSTEALYADAIAAFTKYQGRYESTDES